MYEVEDRVRQTLLYDYYSELLTPQQRNIFESVVFDDYGLSETAKENGISRQGVYDSIRHTLKTLEQYEEKLGLLDKRQRLKEIIEMMQDGGKYSAGIDEIKELFSL